MRAGTSLSLWARQTWASRESIPSSWTRLSTGPLTASQARRTRGPGIVAAVTVGDLVQHFINPAHLD